MYHGIDITTQAFSACPKLTANSTMDTSSVQFRPNPTCHTSAATFDSSAGVDSSCLVNSLQDRLSAELVVLDSVTQQSFGLEPTKDPTNIKLQLNRQVDDTCVDKSSTVSAAMKDTVITSCDWHFVQNATTKSACASNALQKIANKLSVKKQGPHQRSIFRDLFLGDGSIMAILWRILIILCMIGIIYYVFSSICHKQQDNLPSYQIGAPTHITYSIHDI